MWKNPELQTSVIQVPVTLSGAIAPIHQAEEVNICDCFHFLFLSVLLLLSQMPLHSQAAVSRAVHRLQVPFPGIELPMMMPKEKPPITVVGDVGGRIAIIVDDIIDDVDGFVAAAEILKERGAYKIYVMATHGLLSADAPCLIEESAINEVVVTNTIPHEVQKLQCPKIKTVDVSMILSEAIRRIHNGESMSYLFRNITVDD
ncbi:phosphoribosyl pyrophosphate synthase-associated protein 1-like [Heptranchias perlo]|uniref:phosphoribosyl pyrophosphate synthase-associated protein 1-like n=1 Tax=Heptranchias perlo TaxID=212740 RepID=UPI00355A4919